MNLGKTISHHTMRTAQLIACAAIVAPMIGSILPQSALAQAGSTFDYTAATFSEAARQGTVDATSIRWQCRGSRCTVSGPWPQPGVMACRALAQQVGRIKSYGHSGASLNASQLAECNDGAASPVVSNKNVVVQPSQKNLPPTKNKTLTPGPISGPQAGTMSDIPQAILQNGRPAGRFQTARQDWYCDGTRCNIPGQSSPLSGGDNSVDDCARLAQVAGRVTWFSDGIEIFDAANLARCNSPNVTSYEVLACSGADDLRSASHVKIGLNIRGRTFDRGSYRRIFAKGIQANSCQTELVDGPDFRLSELLSIGITFQSYDSGALQTDDNWDMTRIRIMANVREPGGRTAILRVIDEQLEPVKRFESRDSWQYLVRR
jgi:hypothetical protein